jgi:type II secretory pathway predicted ATPase ExeA
MYEQHWQLERAPFDHDRRAESFYSNSLHGEALVKLKYLIEHGKGAASLIGASGTGKTHVLEMVCEQSALNRTVVQIVYPQLSPYELVASIIHEMGIALTDSNSGNAGMDLLLRAFEARLRELTADHREPVIIIDDAHLIEDRRVFQTLHQLMNFQRPGRSNFSLILAGQPELVGTLQMNDQFTDRIAFHSLLQSLTETETAEYVRHRLKSAGRTEPIFDRTALRTVFELSAGIPRRINRLCDFALLVGFVNQARKITAEQIEDVHLEITRSNIAA